MNLIRRTFSRLLIATALIGHSLLIFAQSAPLAKAGALCKQASYRQFDFWVGDWVVVSNQDQNKIVGNNRIDKILLDCVLQENWTSAQGGNGKSFNSYDPIKKQWTQYWVDVHGGEPLLLRGGLQGKAMVLLGEQKNLQTGKPQQQRVTWTPRKDGSVRQHWEQSDDGKIWITAFDGIYQRKKK